MHLLKSYSGCIGTLMAETGIVEILKMLSGKKNPQNVRAFRMLVEEQFRAHFITGLSVQWHLE